MGDAHGGQFEGVAKTSFRVGKRRLGGNARGGVAAGAALVSVILYLIFKNSAWVLERLGSIGTMVMTRLMAFILLCIGIQIMWTGWAELNGLD